LQTFLEGSEGDGGGEGVPKFQKSSYCFDLEGVKAAKMLMGRRFVSIGLGSSLAPGKSRPPLTGRSRCLLGL